MEGLLNIGGGGAKKSRKGTGQGDRESKSAASGAAMPSAIPGVDMDSETARRQAAQIWAMLDEMAANDPAAYQAFLAKQAEEAALDGKPHLLPVPGWSFSTLEAATGRRIVVNMCSHEAIQCPQDAQGKPILDKSGTLVVRLGPDLSMSGLAIPLVINVHDDLGPIEVDVIYHPWVIQQALTDAEFAYNIGELALHWVEDEFSIMVKRSQDKLSDNYYHKTPASRTQPMFPPADGDTKPRNRQVYTRLSTERDASAKKPAPKKKQLTKAEELIQRRLEQDSAAQKSLESPSALLSELGRTGGGEIHPAVSISAAAAPAPARPAAGAAAAPAEAKPRAKPLVEEVLDEPEHTIELIEEGRTVRIEVMLPGVDWSTVELDIAESTIHLLVPGRFKLQKSLPKPVQHDVANAKFSKKHQRLVVLVPAK